MIVVDFDAPGKLRGFARYDESRIVAGMAPGALLGRGHLALTMERDRDAARYQGVVPLEGDGFAEAAHRYFRQSEQIPSYVRLAVAESVTPAGRSWRAGGLLLQYLPETPCARAISIPATRPRAPLCPDGQRRRRLGRRPVAGGDDAGSRARRSGALGRAPALFAVPRARRDGLSDARDRRGLPLLDGAHRQSVCAASRRRTAAI